MNIARAASLAFIGVAFLVTLFAALEQWSLSGSPACQGPTGRFVAVAHDGTERTERDVVAQGDSCVITSAKEEAASAPVADGWTLLGEDWTIPRGSELSTDQTAWQIDDADYEWTDGYALATDTLAGRVLAGGQIAIISVLLVMLAVAALAFREFEGRYWRE